MKRVAGIVVFLGMIAPGFAQQTVQDGQEALRFLSLLRTVSGTKARALDVSGRLLGTPYVLGATGEGRDISYDPDPVWRLDVFDCTTYVEAVLAFANVDPAATDPIGEFEAIVRDIKYLDGDVCYSHRNHFADLQWTPHMILRGYLQDITAELTAHPQTRTKILDIETWYAEKQADVDQSYFSDWTRFHQTAELTSGSLMLPAVVSMTYVPLTELVRPEVMAKLRAEGLMVFNLVKGEHVKSNVPTIIGHQGFIVAKENGLYLRHATPAKSLKKVADVPFEAYVRERMEDTTWPTLGMNILRITGPQ